MAIEIIMHMVRVVRALARTISYNMMSQAPRRGRPAGTKRAAEALSEEDAMARLLAIGDLGDIGLAELAANKGAMVLPHLGPQKAFYMRHCKRAYALEHAREALGRTRQECKADICNLAQVAGIHMPAGSSKPKFQNERTVHAASWSPLQILRVAFTPCSSNAFAAVLDCGNSSPLTARAAVAACAMWAQDAAAQTLFEQQGQQARSQRWAIYCKMHDSTEMELTLSEDPPRNFTIILKTKCQHH